MSYTTDSGRRQIIDDALVAAHDLNDALAELTEAYDLLDEHAADEMEARLFKPTQAALGLLKRTLSEFATRYGLPQPVVRDGNQPNPADPHITLERVADLVAGADDGLAQLQDTLLPVEVGDATLRDGLRRTRELIDRVPSGAEALLRHLGR